MAINNLVIYVDHMIIRYKLSLQKVTYLLRLILTVPLLSSIQLLWTAYDEDHVSWNLYVLIIIIIIIMFIIYCYHHHYYYCKIILDIWFSFDSISFNSSFTKFGIKSCFFLKFSFFPRTMKEWNSVPQNMVELPSLVSFKALLAKHFWNRQTNLN